MRHAEKLRQKYWLFVFGWVFLIYSTLYVARPVCEFLKRAFPFSALVDLVSIAMLLTVVVFIWSKAKVFNLLSYALMAVILVSYINGLMTLQYPEEKIHFIEYGVLAFLVYRAIALDKHAPDAYAISFVLVTVFGWIDEGIQYLLPNRYYQVEDVILNSVSGALGLLLVYVFRKGY